jgi:hypothetical protein
MQREKWNLTIKLMVAPLLIATLLIANPAAALAQATLEVQSSNATTDQYVDGSNQQVPDDPSDSALNQQAPTGPDDPALNQQVPTAPGEPAFDQQAPSGSPNASASSDAEDQVKVAFLQAAIPILQGIIAQAEANQADPSNTPYTVVGGGELAPQQPATIIDPFTAVADAASGDVVCEVIDQGSLGVMTISSGASGNCANNSQVVVVGPPEALDPATSGVVTVGPPEALDPATSSVVTVGGPKSQQDINLSLLRFTLQQDLASNLPEGQTAVQKMVYDKAKDGYDESGAFDASELEPSGQSDPTDTKDDSTGE